MTLKSELNELRARVGALEWVFYQLICVLEMDKAMKIKSLNEWICLAIEAGERRRTLRGLEYAAVLKYASWLEGFPESEQEQLAATWRRMSKHTGRSSEGKSARRSGKSQK